MSEHAELVEAGPILTVTFRREEKLNALDVGMLETLWRAAEQLACRPDLRVMVIRSVGKYFTSGMDLQNEWTQSLFELSETPDLQFRYRYRHLHRLFDEFEAIEKPIVMSVQGPCVGAGVEMAASCDFRFASNEATFSVPEVRFNTVAGSGGVSRLTRIVGPAWAKWLSMAAQSIDADTARQIGLVHDVVPAPTLDERVADFTRELAELPPDAMGLTKLLVDVAVDADRVTARHLDRVAVTTLVRSAPVLNHVARFGRDADQPDAVDTPTASQPRPNEAAD